MQAQKKKLAKRKPPKESFALCGERQRLRALDCATFEKVDETFEKQRLP